MLTGRGIAIRYVTCIESATIHAELYVQCVHKIDDARWTGVLKEIDHVYLLARARNDFVLVIVVDPFRNYGWKWFPQRDLTDKHKLRNAKVSSNSRVGSPLVGAGKSVDPTLPKIVPRYCLSIERDCNRRPLPARKYKDGRRILRTVSRAKRRPNLGVAGLGRRANRKLFPPAVRSRHVPLRKML